jgi:hypothetical protein
MADQVSYWVCKCGAANHKSDRSCNSCGVKKRKTWLLYAFTATVILIAIVVYSDKPKIQRAVSKQQSQIEFQKLKDDYKDKWQVASNLIVKQQIREERDKALARFSKVENWSGSVTGINVMHGKDALTVDVDGTTLVAGDLLSESISTLIDPTDFIVMNNLKTIQIGDHVIVSGEFASVGSALAEISYSDFNSMNDPSFLFKFSSITKN